MHLVQVDVVHLQALQAGVQCMHQVVTRLPAAVDGVVVHGAEGFGRQYDFVPRQPEGLDGVAGHGLRLAGGVHIGGIDEIDAGIEGLFHHGGRRRLVHATDGFPHAGRAAEGHRAQTKFRNVQAGAAQQSVTHGASPTQTIRATAYTQWQMPFKRRSARCAV